MRHSVDIVDANHGKRWSSSVKQKSRSHLCLHRPSSLTQCHHRSRSKSPPPPSYGPESIFLRLPECTPIRAISSRSDSCAIFEVMGIDKPSLYCHTPSSAPSPHRSPVARNGELSTQSPFRREPCQLNWSDSHRSLSSYDAMYQSPRSSTPIKRSPHLTSSLIDYRHSSSQSRILIKGGKCVNDDAIFDADIFIEEGVIKDIGPHLTVPGGTKTIDARGLYVLPGGIDTHTHMNMTFMGAQSVDDFYSGTKAALAGGTTTIMDFVIPEKGANLVDAFKKWRSFADGIACCDFGFRVAISDYKSGKTEQEMETLVKEHGINAFKCFMAYKDSLMLHDEELLNVFQKCRDLGALAMVHAENGDIIDYNAKKLKNLGITGPEGHLQSRPEEVEAEATNRAITIANQVNCPLYVVHVMSRSAADVLASARNRGTVVFGEPITASIGTDGTHYFNKCWRHAAAHVLAPPLRPDRSTSEHLINLLASGQLQTIGSDHCTFNSGQKSIGSNDFTKIPCGVNGVEERLIILWEKAVKTGKLDVKQFVAVTSTNAAKIFNIYPRKGRLAKGSDADVVIWGPKSQVIKAENHHSNVDFNIFEGMHVSNGPLLVISNGKIALDEDGFHVIQGNGRYVPCPANSNYVFGAISQRAKQFPLKVDRSGKEKEDHETAETGGFAFPKISELTLNDSNESKSFSDTNPNFYRGTTRSGVRNLQDSSFSLSGAQIDDDKIGKTAIRVNNPPGGRSSGFW